MCIEYDDYPDENNYTDDYPDENNNTSDRYRELYYDLKCDLTDYKTQLKQIKEKANDYQKQLFQIKEILDGKELTVVKNLKAQIEALSILKEGETEEAQAIIAKKDAELSKIKNMHSFPNKVYIITEGEYSDYHIVAVFLTKEDAQYYMNATKGYSEHMKIEEYETNKTSPPDVDMRFWYDILYHEAMNSFEIYAKIAPFSLSNRTISPFDINLLNVVSPCNVVNSNENYLEVLVRANEDEKAMKIAQDLIAEYKAKREGVV